MPGPLETIQKLGLENIGRWYSSYRGVVVDNIDPEGRQRIKVCVPQFSGELFMWAPPKGQQGALQNGFKWFTPKKGDIVWIEFEMGDPMQPVWSYHGWAKGEVPEELKDNDVAGFITKTGHQLTIDDKNGILVLKIKGLDDEGNYDIDKVETLLEINRGKLKIETTDEVEVDTDKQIVVHSAEDVKLSSDTKIILNNGDEGVPISNKVVERLNILEDIISGILTVLPTGANSGGTVIYAPTPEYPTGLPLPPDKTEVLDIANQSVLQNSSNEEE